MYKGRRLSSSGSWVLEESGLPRFALPMMSHDTQRQHGDYLAERAARSPHPRRPGPSTSRRPTDGPAPRLPLACERRLARGLGGPAGRETSTVIHGANVLGLTFPHQRVSLVLVQVVQQEHRHLVIRLQPGSPRRRWPQFPGRALTWDAKRNPGSSLLLFSQSRALSTMDSAFSRSVPKPGNTRTTV